MRANLPDKVYVLWFFPLCSDTYYGGGAAQLRGVFPTKTEALDLAKKCLPADYRADFGEFPRISTMIEEHITFVGNVNGDGQVKPVSDYSQEPHYQVWEMRSFDAVSLVLGLVGAPWHRNAR